MPDLASEAISKAVSGLLYTAGAGVCAVVAKWIIMPLWANILKRRRLLVEARELSAGLPSARPPATLPPFLHNFPFLREVVIRVGNVFGVVLQAIGGLLVLAICVGLWVEGPWYMRLIFGPILALLVIQHTAFRSILYENDVYDEVLYRNVRDRTRIYWIGVVVMLIFLLVVPFFTVHAADVSAPLSGDR